MFLYLVPFVGFYFSYYQNYKVYKKTLVTYVYPMFCTISFYKSHGATQIDV
jgi:hypothetical protein